MRTHNQSILRSHCAPAPRPASDIQKTKIRYLQNKFTKFYGRMGWFSRVGRENPVLRHSVSCLTPNFRDVVACRVVEQNAWITLFRYQSRYQTHHRRFYSQTTMAFVQFLFISTLSYYEKYISLPIKKKAVLINIFQKLKYRKFSLKSLTWWRD